MTTRLAIEVSSPRGSLALVTGDDTVVERAWTEDRLRNQHAFEELRELLGAAGTTLDAVQTFVVGRGPGTFSSLRIALSLARSAALPGGAGVYTLSSGEALAAETLDVSPAPRVAVVGDARRGAFWYAVFERGPGDLPRPAEWQLCTAETSLEAIPADSLVVTSSLERLRAALPGEVFEARTWVEEDRYPCARWVSKVHAARAAAGIASEPLTPLYMHPPVR